MRLVADCLAMVPLLLPGVAANAAAAAATAATAAWPNAQQARWECQYHRFPVALVTGCAVGPTIFAGHPAGCFQLGAFCTQLLLLL